MPVIPIKIFRDEWIRYWHIIIFLTFLYIKTLLHNKIMRDKLFNKSFMKTMVIRSKNNTYQEMEVQTTN